MLTRFLDYIYIGLGALAAFALFSLYDGLIDDPAVRSKALEGYVLKSENDALAARLAEEERRKNKTAQALEEHRKRLSAALRAEEQLSERLEAEIAEYEAQLQSAGNQCRLDSRDVEWLMRKPG